MGKKCLLVILTLALTVGGSGCATHTHTVGDGPHGGEIQKHGTWYLFWGFSAMDDFDTIHVVGAARDYRITTRYGALDVFFNILMAPLSIQRRTTVIEK